MSLIFDTALELMGPVNYKPFDTGYFVVKNGEDIGGSDYCENCIKEQVNIARKDYKEERRRIIDEHNKVFKAGYYIHNDKKVFVTHDEIEQSLENALLSYRIEAEFDFEGHDPDFGGGLKEPCSCDNCGEYFLCEFTPGKDEANLLLHCVINEGTNLDEKTKWEIEAAFNAHHHVSAETKNILKQVADKIIQIF